jgi:tRNA/rRNA methyltransferase
MDIRFVLVEPAVPENVGAAARAIKTMGFRGLRIVASEVHRDEKALWTAHGSRDVLEGAEIFDALKDALADRDYVIATTARRRGFRHDYYPPEALVPLIRDKGVSALRTAIVFGGEESGLSNRDLELCDCVSSIPLAAAYPSLNLSQAVMLYAYVLSPFAAGNMRGPGAVEAGVPEYLSESASDGVSGRGLPYRALKKRVGALLDFMEFDEKDLVRKRLLERLAPLSGDDIKLLHSLCARLEKISNPRERNQ